MRRPAPSALLASLALLAILGPLAPARADDTADEADLHFRLGAEAYQRQDYPTALVHFHASNRLAPNHNVLFNIARTYEILGDFPAAFRYYDLSLEGETVPAARANVEAALARVASEVAVVQVQTTPPGATIYVDRRDLGPRGCSPRRLGLKPGTYRILAELPGHDPATATVAVQRGETATVHLDLHPILGALRIAGTEGAAVRLDEPRAPVACVTPCDLQVPPGRHPLFLSRPGFQDAVLTVEVAARQTTAVEPELVRRTGTVTVSTDDPGALVEIDGAPMGFTPTVVPLPIGEHTLRVSRPGFEAVERRVNVAESILYDVQLSLVPRDEIEAASRVAEDSARAPSSVTVIPRAELVAFAYPTLAEALRGTRGVYQWDDRAYVTLGFRGLGRLGSYGNRVLVLADGTPTNDDWVGASFVGYDAMTDLGDVERIEVVRGPGSALYGTGAFSGVINVVTREVEETGTEVAVGTELDGVARARVRGAARLGERGSIWLSVGAARGAGRDFFFPEYAAVTPPGAPPGYAVDVDGFAANTARGRLRWCWLSAQWLINRHRKTLPAHYETIFGDPDNENRDTRGLVELRAEPALGATLTLTSRLYLNHYDFLGTYARAPEDGGDQYDEFVGRWIGTEHRLRYQPSDALRVTVGGEVQRHFQVEERGWDQTGIYLDLTGSEAAPFTVGAAYGVIDADLAPAVRVSAGARLDAYSSWGSSVNPRAAVIVRPYATGNTKLLFGRAFRAPSVYEQEYNDGGATQVVPLDPLHPETIYTVELEHTHRFDPTLSLTGAAHASTITDLIDTAGAGNEDDPLYFHNIASPLVTTGGELSLRRDWRQGFMGLVGYTFTAARFLASGSAADLVALRADPDLRHVANVPTHAATFKGAAPILARRLTLASRLTVESGRWDRMEAVGDAPQQRTDPFALWDLVLSGHETALDLEYAVGVYNLFDWRYRLPVSGDLVGRSIEQSGRTLLASLAVAL